MALVAGASRGIGLALVRKLLSSRDTRRVYASYRQASTSQDLLAINDSRLVTVSVDITDPSELKALADTLRSNGDQPDLVINAAGILHEQGIRPEKALGQCRQESLSRLFMVNSIGPLLLAKSIIPLMPKTGKSHFAVLSAMVGSITDNRLGGWYGYRASKAALNQFMRTLAIECRRSHPGLCVTAIHPGTTDTSLSQPFQSNVKPGKLYTTAQTAERIVRVVGAGQPEQSGRFVNWDGETLPW